MFYFTSGGKHLFSMSAYLTTRKAHTIRLNKYNSYKVQTVRSTKFYDWNNARLKTQIWSNFTGFSVDVYLHILLSILKTKIYKILNYENIFFCIYKYRKINAGNLSTNVPKLSSLSIV